MARRQRQMCIRDRLVDALVESHLNPFEKVMSEDIEKSKNDEKEIKK